MGGALQGGVNRLGAKDHREQHRRFGSERGAASTTNLVVIAVVIVAGLVSVTLLARTTRAANRINAKAERIAKTGQGINIATDSVIQLNRTNETASSILATAKPLEGKLGEIVNLAQSVDGLATSINGTAGTINATGGKINGTAGEINSTAGRINKTAKDINTTARAIAGSAGSINTSALKINGTAKDINTQAAAILNVARRINDDVAQINKNLDGTIGLANAIKGDTGNILGEAQKAQKFADCIDKRIGVAAPCP